MKIRLATPEDAESVAAIYAPIVLETTISFEWDAPSAEDFRTRIAKTLAKYPWLVAVDGSDEVAGFVYASSHRDPPSYQWSVNTSVFIRKDARVRCPRKAVAPRFRVRSTEMEIGPMKKRYTEEQIIGFLRKADAGPPVKELCRKHGFSEPCH